MYSKDQNENNNDSLIRYIHVHSTVFFWTYLMAPGAVICLRKLRQRAVLLTRSTVERPV